MKDLSKYIKIPDSLYKEVKERAKAHNLNEYKFHTTITQYDVHTFSHLNSFLIPLDLYCYSYRIFICPGNFSKTDAIVHIDASNLQAALNVPVERESILHYYPNKENTKILRLYPDSDLVRTVVAYKENITLDEEEFITYFDKIKEYTKDWVPDCSVPIDRATLVRNHIWHTISNPAPNPRFLLSFIFKGNPTFERVVEKFDKADLIDAT